MNQAIEAIPLFGKFCKGGFDLTVFGHIAGKNDLAAESCSKLFDTLFKTLAYKRKGKFCTLFVTGFCDAVGDRTIGDHACDQNTFAGEKAHGLVLEVK